MTKGGMTCQSSRACLSSKESTSMTKQPGHANAARECLGKLSSRPGQSRADLTMLSTMASDQSPFGLR
ncbi:hypothetical protein U1Q18_050109, partial [Sarracenia purpurea var. burkii]